MSQSVSRVLFFC